MFDLMTERAMKKTVTKRSTKRGGCASSPVPEDILSEVRRSIPEEETLYEAADFFRMFGDTTRIKILHALLLSELSVCDLSGLLGVSQSAVSHQLNGLRQTNLVKYRRQGKTVYYSLKDEHVQQILDVGMQHILEKKSPGANCDDEA